MWDKRYSDESYAYGKKPNDFLYQNASSLPVGSTLCLGEGEGRNAVFLAGLGHEVTALDSSSVGLKKAEKLATEAGVTISTVHADLNDYVLEAGRWDTIVSIFCHLPAPLRRKVHAQVKAALRPGGMFILEAYTPEQLEYGTGGPPSKEMMMDRVSLKEELAGLDSIHLVETVREVHEGEFHNGTGTVVQLIAVRN